jgi:hypothetical protein
MGSTTFVLPQKWYNLLKWVAQILLPAVGTLYVALAAALGLPAAEQVAASVLAVDTFLGALLGLSSKQFYNSDDAYDGKVVVTPDEENDLTDFNFTVDPASLESGQDKLLIKVDRR